MAGAEGSSLLRSAIGRRASEGGSCARQSGLPGSTCGGGLFSAARLEESQLFPSSSLIPSVTLLEEAGTIPARPTHGV